MATEKKTYLCKDPSELEHHTPHEIEEKSNKKTLFYENDPIKDTYSLGSFGSPPAYTAPTTLTTQPSEAFYIRQRKRNWIDKLCCGCLRCCPKWIRWATCTIFTILLLAGLIIGILFGTFRMPEYTIEYPYYQSVKLQNGTLTITNSITVSINNNNPEAINIEDTRLTADLPYFDNPSLSDIHCPDSFASAFSTKALDFDLDLSFNTTNVEEKTLLKKIATTCVEKPHDNKISLELQLVSTVRVATFTTKIEINRPYRIPCPKDKIWNATISAL
ncbi:hypothetical protein BY458DRAFT_492675 [Sporodiniella umbellata]|nr:hypothetical protein BY458DRAFT_492675 [Sporodiniella umbellata]